MTSVYICCRVSHIHRCFRLFSIPQKWFYFLFIITFDLLWMSEPGSSLWSQDLKQCDVLTQMHFCYSDTSQNRTGSSRRTVYTQLIYITWWRFDVPVITIVCGLDRNTSGGLRVLLLIWLVQYNTTLIFFCWVLFVTFNLNWVTKKMCIWPYSKGLLHKSFQSVGHKYAQEISWNNSI